MTPTETTLHINGQPVTIRYRPPGSYRPNPANSNQGAERGDAAIRRSLQDTGFHRGIFTAADGTVIGGNHAYQAAEEEGIVDGWIEIESTGKLGIATRRIDWKDGEDPKAILAALADNRTQELNFVLDSDQLAADLATLEALGASIPPVLYTEAELAAAMQGLEDLAAELPPGFDPIDSEAESEGRMRVPGDKYLINGTLTYPQHQEWLEDKASIGAARDIGFILECWQAWRDVNGRGPIEV